MGVLDYVKDRLGNRGALTKTPRDRGDEELTSGYGGDDLGDYPPISQRDTGPDLADYAAPSVSEVAEMEPSEFTSKLSPEAKKSKVLKDISEKNIEDAFKRDKKAIDSALEPITSEKGTLLPKTGTEEDYMPIDFPEETVPPVPPATQGTTKPEVETPKAEIPKTEVPPTVTPEMPKSTVEPLVTETKKEKVSGKSRWDTFKENITGTDGSVTEMEYARRGGYTEGVPKSEYLLNIETIKKENENIRTKIKDIEIDLEQLLNDKRDATKKLKNYAYGSAERTNINNEIKRMDYEISKLENRKSILEGTINSNNEKINKYRMLILKYDKYVEIGKARPSLQRVAIGKKLQALGEGSEMVSSGVYSGKSFGRGDWFGQKGFLSQPFKQENITRSAVQPVKVATRNLDAITRSTGGSVSRSIIDVTQVRPSRSIAPLGVPGTVAGAKQRFEYDIPAKKITPGDITTNINRDIMPSIFAPPRQLQAPAQVQQVMQQDGTIMEVPVQQRKQKFFTVSVNRFTNKGKNAAGVRKIDAANIVTGVDKFKPFKSVKAETHGDVYCGTKKVGKIDTCVKMAKMNIGLEDIGQSRSLKTVTIGKRPQVELGIRGAKSTGFTIDGNGSSNVIETVKTEDRKSKVSTPKVNMKAALKIGGNLDKFLLKKKQK